MKIAKHIQSIPKIVRLIKNWPVYYLDKLGFFGKRKILTIQLRDGVKLRVHSGNSDVNSFAELYFTDHYSKLLNQLDPDLDFVDIGANIGTVSIAVASRLRGGRVYAFEPNPNLAGTPFLRRHL